MARSIEELVFDLLAADGGVTAIVGARVFGPSAPRGPAGAFPRVRVQVISDVDEEMLSVHSNCGRARVQVRTESIDYDQAIDLATAVRAALTLINLETDGWKLIRSSLAGVRDTTEALEGGSDVMVHSRSADWLIVYRRP